MSPIEMMVDEACIVAELRTMFFVPEYLTDAIRAWLTEGYPIDEVVSGILSRGCFIVPDGRTLTEST